MPQKKRGLSTKITSLLLAVCTAGAALLAGCSGKTSSAKTLTILSASENKEIVPVFSAFTKKTGINIKMEYKGSVDIMQTLGQKSIPYDAVWPANSMWINLGDTNHKVKLQQSIMVSPVVIGVRKSLAQSLGYVGKDVTVADILRDVEAKKLRFCMTSATQSNSGASAYIGFLYALRGNPDVLTQADLQDTAMQSEMKTLLGGIDRSSGSSEWLKDLFLTGGYDAMVNYESVIISTNQALVKKGQEPLYVVYPKDGLTIADSPLGYVDNGDAKKQDYFNQFQSWLLSSAVQKQLLQYGRRTGVGGTAQDGSDAVFNPDWGIDRTRTLTSLKMPASDVLLSALQLYQTALRKPSYTVYCLDYSGSMAGNGGEKGLKQAMGLLLQPAQAAQALLQPTAQDVTVVIPFADTVKATWQVTGDDASRLASLYQNVNNLQAGGGTDIYTPVNRALSLLQNVDQSQYNVSIILMTDGESNTGASYNDVKREWTSVGKDIPVFPIAFGSASNKQLSALATLTKATVFDGKGDLTSAFKKAKGYN